jgi:hypothetical protein
MSLAVLTHTLLQQVKPPPQAAPGPHFVGPPPLPPVPPELDVQDHKPLGVQLQPRAMAESREFEAWRTAHADAGCDAPSGPTDPRWRAVGG